jgi:predicted ABC-type ATPase
VYIIAGPNGAGKTTFAKVFLPKYMKCRTFINADLIAGGLAPLKPDEIAFKAGKMLLGEVKAAALRGEDFGFETTLSGRSYVHLFKKLKEMGYAIHLFFLWIPILELSIKRIQDRVRRGGHLIPEDVAKRRFHRGIFNLFHLYAPLIDSWSLMDNSGPTPTPIASKNQGGIKISDPKRYQTITRKAKP